MTEPTHTPLPCPFCGGEAETDLMQPFRHYRTGEPLSQPAVYCTVCSAQIAHYPGDVDLSRDETMDLALTAWNTRAPSHHDLIEALREELVWHEDHDKAISKQPNANTGDNGWRRMEHQERIAALTAILTKAEAGHG